MTSAAGVFREAFGTSPDGVWAAPGRVNLIGGHTDYNGGLVLPFAIDQRTQAAIGRRSDGRVRICSAQAPGDLIEIDAAELEEGHPSGWGAYVAGVLWTLRTTAGFDIAIDSRISLGSGLSSSAALICAVGLGLNEILELGHSRRELARLTQRTENEYVGAQTGGMDQIASLLCTAGHALLYDAREDTIDQIPFDPVGAGLRILAVDTTVRHGHIYGTYSERRAECEEASRILGVDLLRSVSVNDLEPALERLGDARLIKRVRHVVTENQRVVDTAVALAAKDWSDTGRLLTAAHASIRDDFEASCPELDLAVDTLLSAGALGARMTGGGFGGTAVSLMPHQQADSAHVAVHAAFADHGFRPPRTFTVVPSAGARRIA